MTQLMAFDTVQQVNMHLAETVFEFYLSQANETQYSSLLSLSGLDIIARHRFSSATEEGTVTLEHLMSLASFY